jgi:hypothetical protein
MRHKLVRAQPSLPLLLLLCLLGPSALNPLLLLLLLLPVPCKVKKVACGVKQHLCRICISSGHGLASSSCKGLLLRVLGTPDGLHQLPTGLLQLQLQQLPQEHLLLLLLCLPRPADTAGLSSQQLPVMPSTASISSS